LKEISSDGNVNTLVVIFPMIPLFEMYNSNLIELLLRPILNYIDKYHGQRGIAIGGGRWKDFAIHDIGSSYPNATGHPDGVAEDMPIEESGNLILALFAS
jgi:Domain of unknown function (DUF4965)